MMVGPAAPVLSFNSAQVVELPKYVFKFVPEICWVTPAATTGMTAASVMVDRLVSCDIFIFAMWLFCC